MQLHLDAQNGDVAGLARALEAGVPVDARDETGLTPLMIAASRSDSNSASVRFLLQHGADPNAIGGEYPESVLMHAVAEGDAERVAILLDAGADIAFAGEHGYDVLMCAARRSDAHLLPILDLLIDRGVPLSREDDAGASALTYASDDGRFEAVKRLLAAGADATGLSWTPLMQAVALESAADLRAQLASSPDLSVRDDWKRTAWLLSIVADNVEKAGLLLAAVANLGDAGWCGKTALVYAIEVGHLEMLRWLLAQGLEVDAADDFGKTALMQAASHGAVACVGLLLDAGADLNRTDDIGHNALAHAYLPEVVRLLVAAGADLNQIQHETRASFLGLDFEGEIKASREEFEKGSPRFGKANPEPMDIPFWRAMVRSGASTYAARKLFETEENIYGEDVVPVWCNHRFGQSLTELPDGRFLQIGGEHEDSYDPDFCIYNDAFVHEADGGFHIFGYPREVFPPTEFHSATCFGNWVYIIGCIGYPEQRIAGFTPVYRLNIENFSIQRVETSGENPGWIYRHKAVLRGDEIHISGGQVWTQSADEQRRAPRKQEQAALLEYLTSLQELGANNFDFQQSDEKQAVYQERLEATEAVSANSYRYVLNLASFVWHRET